MTPRLARRLAAALATLLLCLPAAAQIGAPPEVLSLRLAADTEKIVAGSSFRVALVATIAPGWHVNSDKPLEDYLIPTEAAVAPAVGLSFAAPAYPAHKEQ